MKRILRIAYPVISLLSGLIIGVVLSNIGPEHYNNSIYGWHTKHGTGSTEYLEGTRTRAEILAEAVSRNSSLAIILQQTPELIYDPVVNVIWHQNVIIIQTEADYWHNEVPPAGYEQFHFSAVHTANMCATLVQFTEDLLWPSEEYNLPSRFVGVRIRNLYTSCFDGLADIFAFLDLETEDM